MQKLKSPENSPGLGFAGIFYPTDENGIVHVPQEAVVPALAHGFTVYSEPKTAKKLEALAKGAEAPDGTDAANQKK